VLPELRRNESLVRFDPALLVDAAEIGGVLKRRFVQYYGHESRRYSFDDGQTTRTGMVLSGRI
jgi:hypothetical protein